MESWQLVVLSILACIALGIAINQYIKAHSNARMKRSAPRFKGLFRLQEDLQRFMEKHSPKDKSVPLVDDLTPAGEATRLLNDVLDQIYTDQGLVGAEAVIENIPENLELSAEARIKVSEFHEYILDHQ